MASLAELLDYDQRKKQALQALTDYASSQYKLGSAFGEGLSDQAKGIVQMVAHPWDTGTQMYEAGKAAVQNPKAALQAAKEGLTEAVSSPENISRFAGQNFNPLELANALKNVGTMREIVVHHGTPHRFEPTEANPVGEFDANKIGTGEGNQAYGHGVYLAESPDVAKSYISAGGTASGLPQKYAADLVGMMRGEQKAIEHLKHIMPPKGEATFSGESHDFIQKALENIKSGAYKQSSGSLYKADLPDEMVDRMLDWDKPLSEQPHIMKAVLNKDEEWTNYAKELSPENRLLAKDMVLGSKPVHGDEAYEAWMKLQKDHPNLDHNVIYDARRRINPQVSDQDWLFNMLSGSGAVGSGVRGGGGADFYNSFGGSKEAAEQLRSMGIPGIKYLDAGSRGQTGTGTRNFVVFPGEEKKVKILERK